MIYEQSGNDQRNKNSKQNQCGRRFLFPVNQPDEKRTGQQDRHKKHKKTRFRYNIKAKTEYNKTRAENVLPALVCKKQGVYAPCNGKHHRRAETGRRFRG